MSDPSKGKGLICHCLVLFSGKTENPEKGGTAHQLLEPRAQVVVAPYGGNSNKIPNEDSKAMEFDETNLITMNRFSGLDRVEGGPRLNYGLKWGLFGKGGGSTVFRIGQSYRPKADDTFAVGSGVDDNFSDIVGSIQVSPARYLDTFYRTRLDKDDLSAKRHELSVSAGPPSLYGGIKYIFFDREEGSEFSVREQLSLSAGTRLTKHWRAKASGLRDLVDDEMRNFSMSLIYEDECFTFDTSASRTFYEDRDLKPTDSIVFTITFKTLGEAHTGITSKQN